MSVDMCNGSWQHRSGGAATLLIFTAVALSFKSSLANSATAGSNKGAAFLGTLDGDLTDEQIKDAARIFSHDIESRVVRLADDPRVFSVDDFLSDEECDFLKQHGEPLLQQSLTIDRVTGEYHPDKVRTNYQMYISKEDCVHHPVISQIVRRMYRLARIPLGHGEQVQIGRYRVGEKYDCHYDSEVSVDVVRPATIIVYISDVEAGGDTIFPMGQVCSLLENCCAQNKTRVRRLHPKKGRAILFYTHDFDGGVNKNALHGSCPVEEGEKWIIQAWFRASLYHESPHYQFSPGAAEVDAKEHDPAESEL